MLVKNAEDCPELTSYISIQPENIIPQPPDGPDEITHAYNRLCDNKMGI